MRPSRANVNILLTCGCVRVVSLQDEVTCIGCKQCVWHAPGCFRCVQPPTVACELVSLRTAPVGVLLPSCCEASSAAAGQEPVRAPHVRRATALIPGGSWPCSGTDWRVWYSSCTSRGCLTRGVLRAAVCRMEPEHGRSRVFAQWLNTEDDIQAAVGEPAGLHS
jgi:hypothetical protein